MTADAKPRIKITYATLRADNEDLHTGFEEAVARVRAGLGDHHRNFVDGTWRDGDGTFDVRSPIDRDIVLGTFARGTAADVDAAVAAARAAQPAWAATPWPERLAIVRKAAELISDRLMDDAAVMSFEVGKNRIEALGEVEESADLIRYYAQTMEDNAGYDHPLDNLGDAAVHTRSILRPHGVFAVVSPFNFPMALAAGPTSAAMMAGNTVVFKPSSASPLSAIKLMEAYIDAGVPAGVVNLVMGPGETVGQALQDHPGIDGIVFTGSYEVGMRLFHSFSKQWPRPCIVEMGGKNPAIVTRHADLDEAAEGIMRAAFGFGGQKCSANSRVYVEREVHDEFV
ncbi:MAG TPA: aldehyde dehydrogenase family protein, partial [Candidatus Limnocylindrales bacterium]